MIVYSYNRQITPPAPFVHITVQRPDKAAAVPDVPAQLDTAADTTVVPASVVEILGLVQLGEAEIMGFGGHITTVPTFLVSLAVREFEPILVKVLANPDEPCVLLGRDVLNQYRVLLDGPRLKLQIDQ